MYRKFIATVTAASIALTALGATTAKAGEYDNARAIAAILGLAVVGKIIYDKHQDRKDQGREVSRHAPAPVYEHARPSHKQYKQRNNYRSHQPEARPLPHRASRKLLPGQCLRSFETRRRGTVRMFGNRCLQRNFDYAQRLPQHCQTRVRTPNGKRHGYEARCLRDAGYRLARR